MEKDDKRTACIAGKIVIRGKLRLDAPLAIGSGRKPETHSNEADSYVLRDENGMPYISGTSLAGVLRSSFLSSPLEKERRAAMLLFGHSQNLGTQKMVPDVLAESQSMIDVSDITLCMPSDGLAIRDGIAINTFTGTTEERKKYNYEVVERGATGELELILTLRQAHSDMAEEIWASTCAIVDRMASGIQLGAHTAKGLGWISCGDETYAVRYDFRRKQDIAAWLAYDGGTLLEEWAKIAAKEGRKIHQGRRIRRRDKMAMCIQAEFDLRGPILIVGKNMPHGRTASKKNESHPMMSKDEYLIPGSSVKGVLRHHAEHILRLFGHGPEYLYDMMGYSMRKAEAEKAGLLSDRTKSRFSVKEITIKKESLVNDEEQTRIRIDRFTGGAMETSLFTEFPLWRREEAEKPIRLEFSLAPGADGCIAPWEAGLMLFLLRDLWQGRVAFGEGKSIGRGTLQGRSAKIFLRKGAFGTDWEGIPAADDEIEIGENGMGPTDAQQALLEQLSARFHEKMCEKGEENVCGGC